MYKTVAADFDRIDFEFEKSSALRCYQIVLSNPEKPLIKERVNAKKKKKKEKKRKCWSQPTKRSR